MAERDDRGRRRSRAGRGGQDSPPGARRRRRPEPQPGQTRQPNGPPRPRPSPHTLRLEVGGHGVELHCDTCELVVTHLAGPEVRRAVEEAHRQHLGDLTWESAWVGVCTCGWRTGRLKQDAARQQLVAHEASVLRPAAKGERPPSG